VNELTGTKHSPHMDTELDSGARDPGPLDWGPIAKISSPHERDVALSFQFRADSSRVFYALSIPEYIEAWLQAPDTDDLHFAFNQVAEETFRIDLYRGEALQASIDASCWVVGTNQVRYIWKTISPIDTTETIVDMKLLAGSCGCVLALKHSGFNNPAETARCRRMWQQSLERLGRLVEKN
jgi:Activator of Hsp90 ATPase homolog 1-like protein